MHWLSIAPRCQASHGGNRSLEQPIGAIGLDGVPRALGEQALYIELHFDHCCPIAMAIHFLKEEDLGSGGDSFSDLWLVNNAAFRSQSWQQPFAWAQFRRDWGWAARGATTLAVHGAGRVL